MENFEFNRMRNVIENKSKKEDFSKVLKPHDDFEVDEKDKKEFREFNEFESLRISLQELLDPQTEESNLKRKEDIKVLKDILSEDLLNAYKDILKDFREASISSDNEENLKYGFIDIENENLVDKIDNWIESVKNVAMEKQDWNEEDFVELESQCWIFFDSLALSLNVKSLERNIKTKKLFRENENYKNDKQRLVNEMKEIYPFDEQELDVLVDLISDKENEYNFNSLKDTLVYVYKRYELNEIKGKSAKALGTYLLANSLQALGPFFLQDMSSDKAAMSSLKFIGSYVSAERVEAKAELMQIEVDKYISEKINQEIGKSLLFRDFEFIHDKTTGEIYETLIRGKESTVRLINLVNSKVIPKIYSLVASISLLSKINPVLGGIGLAGVPVMLAMAKKQNKKIGKIYNGEMIGQEKANVQITQTKELLEEVRATGLAEESLRELTENLNKLDELKFKREGLEIKSQIARMLPSHITAASSVVIGEMLRRGGYVDGGAILSSVIYSYQLNEPIQGLVGLYYESFPRLIQSIDKMKEILGEDEDLDLPEGEREKYRISVSELDNFNIDIKNLRHKNISKEINLKINEGDFITITGESGAGKTTLLRHIMGLFKSDSGNITMGAFPLKI